jgi:hypothetical protein
MDGDSEHWQASSEASLLAARILRAIVFDADRLRDEANRLARLSWEHAEKADEIKRSTDA